MIYESDVKAWDADALRADAALAEASGAGWLMFTVDGTEWGVPLKFGPDWLKRATAEDFRRVAVR